MFALSQFPLPYDSDSLAPYMSEQTLDFHHGKHLATYINTLNDLIAGTDYESMPLIEIVRKSASDKNATKIFNNAAQVFNHNFFFHGLRKNNSQNVPDEIAACFGGSSEFRKKFKSAAAGVFGSGWAWLIWENNTAQIITTANADTPIAHGQKPLLALDVWEHAYYLDYQNRRGDFIDTFLDNLINWNFVQDNLALYKTGN